jgi:hypothetical protein
MSQPMCVEDIEVCCDQNSMHNNALQESYCFKIWIYKTNEKEKNQYQFFFRIMTMTNIVLLLEPLIKDMKGTKKYVPKKTFQFIYN